MRATCLAAVRVAELLALLVIGPLPAATSTAFAGPASDALGRCLTQATTNADRVTFMKWFFTVIALHPDVQALSAVTPEQRAALSRESAEILQRLLTEKCAAEAREALISEGGDSIAHGFVTLSQQGVVELLMNPKLQEGITEIGKYLDLDKLRKVLRLQDKTLGSAQPPGFWEAPAPAARGSR
jgi:hypothetical protein